MHTKEKPNSWNRVLSSIMKTEGTEDLLLTPVLEYYRDDQKIYHSLLRHKNDESKHEAMLSNLLKKEFGSPVLKATFTDKVLYKKLLNTLSQYFRKNPYPCFILLYAVEVYSVKFYQSAIDRVKNATLSETTKNEITNTLSEIIEDERSHIKLMAEMIKYSNKSFFGVLFSYGLLAFFKIDMCMSKLALYNRDIQWHLNEIGFSRKEMAAFVNHSIKISLTKI